VESARENFSLLMTAYQKRIAPTTLLADEEPT